MSKKIKALISLVTCIVMSSSFVIGCGGGSDSSSNSSSSSSSQSASSSAATPGTGDDGANSSTTPADSSTTPAPGNSSTTPADSSSEAPADSSSEAPADSSSEAPVDSSSTTPVTPVAGTYTYNTYTSVSPSNWNELTYQDNNDTQIMSYLNSPLFEFDFKFDEEGEIVPGDFEVEYSFATALKDVSDKYGYEADAGMAWQITIREDGKWNDGTAITAKDFLYTAQEQLNPLFLNYRANTFYDGAMIIKNAEAYVKQGSAEFRGADSKYDTWDEAKADSTVTFDILSNNTYFGAWANSQYPSYYDNAGEGTGWAWLVCGLGAATTPDAVLAMQGKTWAEIEADPALKAAWDATIAMWQTEPNEELHFFGYDDVWGSMDWANVGFYAPDDYNIVLELEQPLFLLDGDELSYKAAYNMASLPLVKRDLYEANKVAPAEGSTLWTSKYHSSLETTASWGPYMLTEFQPDKMYKMEKNPNWYGWNMDKYDGLYQTTHIVCETIKEYDTAFMKFLQGGLTSIGINVTVADDYKNSDRAYFTPSDFVSSLQLQASAEGLKAREEEGINKTILLQPEFRKALSLGLDRNSYAKATTTSSLKGLGLFNSMHYYDVANGKAYRESDAAKLVLCEVYGVNPDDYASLDDAVDAITGFDLAQARALVDAAYDKAIEAGDLKETDKVVLTYGTSTDNAAARRYYDNLKNQWIELMKGTKLEGKFDLEFDASFQSQWANAFRNGEYDICQGGWTGAAWDPGYLLMAYLDPGTAYSATWDTSKEMATFTVPGVNADGEVTNDEADSYTAELSLWAWWELLNGDWQAGVLDDQFRVSLIADLEGAVLTKYYSVPVMYEFSASLMGYQVDYITYEYNTFMSYGGIQYMTYNYDDAEWAEFVKENKVNGELNYK